LNTTEKREDGTEKPVAYIAMEPILGGELFDYVANSGAFEDKFCRHFFKQMLMGLHYLHSKGNAHRDLKPENVMLDNTGNIKIIDFGFTCNIAGRNGSGMNQTGVGTPGYMAPEILMKQAYQSNVVDLFALGVILFIMKAGHPPFSLAKEDDTYYKLIATQRADLFWKAHSNKKPAGFFSEEFKDMITAMFQLQPQMRICLSNIVGHPWMSQEYPTPQEVEAEFSRRLQINKARAAEDEERKNTMQNNVADRRSRRGQDQDKPVFLNVDDIPDDLQNVSNCKKLTLKQYKDSDNKHMNFFSSFDEHELMTQIINYLNSQNSQFKVSERSFKVTFESQRQINADQSVACDDDDAENEEENKQEEAEPIYEKCQVAVRLLKVNDKKICVDFQKKSGGSMLFYDAIAQMKHELSLCNNTTLDDE